MESVFIRVTNPDYLYSFCASAELLFAASRFACCCFQKKERERKQPRQSIVSSRPSKKTQRTKKSWNVEFKYSSFVHFIGSCMARVRVTRTHHHLLFLLLFAVAFFAGVVLINRAEQSVRRIRGDRAIQPCKFISSAPSASNYRSYNLPFVAGSESSCWNLTAGWTKDSGAISVSSFLSQQSINRRETAPSRFLRNQHQQKLKLLIVRPWKDSLCCCCCRWSHPLQGAARDLLLLSIQEEPTRRSLAWSRRHQ